MVNERNRDPLEHEGTIYISAELFSVLGTVSPKSRTIPETPISRFLVKYTFVNKRQAKTGANHLSQMQKLSIILAVLCEN